MYWWEMTSPPRPWGLPAARARRRLPPAQGRERSVLLGGNCQFWPIGKFESRRGDGGGPVSSSPTSSIGLDLADFRADGYLILEFCYDAANGFTQPSLADSIKIARKARGLLQKDLAALVGVNPKTAARWERGRIPHGMHMEALVQILGLYG